MIARCHYESAFTHNIIFLLIIKPPDAVRIFSYITCLWNHPHFQRPFGKYGQKSWGLPRVFLPLDDSRSSFFTFFLFLSLPFWLFFFSFCLFFTLFLCPSLPVFFFRSASHSSLFLIRYSFFGQAWMGKTARALTEVHNRFNSEPVAVAWCGSFEFH